MSDPEIIRNTRHDKYSDAEDAAGKVYDDYGRSIDAIVECTGLTGLPIVTNYDGTGWWTDKAVRANLGTATKKRVYSQYFSGTADSNQLLSFAHGLTENNIVDVNVRIGSHYGVDGTIITDVSTGASALSVAHLSMLNGDHYVVRIDYV